MMNIVWRYIDELVGKGLSAGIIIELMTYFMANMIPLGLPLAMLLAAIMTMGNLGENYELLAMKSAGMSLVRITKPLIILVSVIAVGSFFIGNNLVPYANKKVYSIIYTPPAETEPRIPGRPVLQRHRQHVDPREPAGTQNAPAARRTDLRQPHRRRQHEHHRGRLGLHPPVDDKRFLLVTLFNGEMYEQTRNSQWFTQSRLRHHIFDKQDQTIPMEGFAMQRSDANQFSNSQTKNINELQQDIDSLEILVNNATTRRTNHCSRNRYSHATTPCCRSPTACAKTRAASAASKRWTPSRHSNSATRRGYGTRRGRWPKVRATCSRSTSRPPRRRSTSSTAARSSGTRKYRSPCRS